MSPETGPCLAAIKEQSTPASIMGGEGLPGLTQIPQDRGSDLTLGASEIRAHIEKIAQSKPFERSMRMQRFLRFICDEMLAGRGDELKEYSIALEVFDKPADFDPGSSAVIRVEAGRLRRLLGKYASEHGEGDQLELIVPKGSYCPVVQKKMPPQVVPQLNGTESEPPERAQILLADMLPAGERRWLSAVSCQLGEERFSAGDVNDDFLSAYDEALSACEKLAKAHGGNLERGPSGRVTIYFGWPDPIEDSSGRAITAALEIVEDCRDLLKSHGGVRVGVATSQVVAKQSTDKPIIMGQAPALASRMLALAPRDSVIVSEQSRRMSTLPFEVVSADSIETSGGDVCLLWRVLRPHSRKTRFDTIDRSGESSMVGRVEEMQLLLSRWRLAHSGEGQAVVIEGEAGIGKSRLSEALLEATASEAVQYRVQCSPHHTNSPLYPWIDLVHQLAGLDSTECSGKQDIQTLLDRFGLDSPVNRSLLENLLFLSVSGPDVVLPARERRERTLQLVLRLLFESIRGNSAVVLIEDIHWADPTTIELIEKIVSQAPSSQLLLLMTGRPISSPHLALHTSITYIRLSRMPKAESGAIVDRLANSNQLSDQAKIAILERGEGIPLFLEELTKLFLTIDATLNSRAVPESLNSLLVSQLGRLGMARKIAQVATVIGREFSPELLAAVAAEREPVIESALDQLVAAGILNRTSPDMGARYSFRHALLRDAAYASILEVDKKELHHRVAEALGDQSLSGGVERPEIIAGHLRDAGCFDESIPLWLEAGRKAASRYELAEAITDYRQALEALSQCASDHSRDEQELEILLQLGLTVRTANGYGDPELQAIYERTRTLAEKLQRTMDIAGSIYGLWTHAAGKGQWPIASSLAEEFYQLSRTIDDNGQIEVEALRLRGACAAFSGQFSLARLHFERAIKIYNMDEHGPGFGFDPGAASTAYLSWVLWHLGEEDRAFELAFDAIEIAEAKGHPATLAMVLSWVIFHAVCSNEIDAIHEYNARLQTLCTEGDCKYWQPFGAACAEWAAYQIDGKREHLDKMLGLIREFKEHYLEACLLLLASDLCRHMNRPQQGLELVAQAEKLIEANGERLWEAECNRLTGELLLLLPDPDKRKANQLFRRALRVAKLQEAIQLERRARVAG